MSEDRAPGTEKRPAARWGKRLGIALVVLLAVAVLGHWWWGQLAAGRLDAAVERYRAAGEPMLPSDLVVPPVPDDQNAVVDLRAAAALIDSGSEAWQAFDRLRPALPLTDREIAVHKRLIDEGQDALARVRQAAGKPGVDWQMQFPTPVLLNLDLRDLNRQRQLARLLGAAALYAHHAGDDAEAVQRLRELLFVSRAVGRQPVLISDLVSIGLSAIASERVEQIAPDLRIAGAGAADDATTKPASPEQVKALLAELLDAQTSTANHQRALRGERVLHVDAARALVDGKLNATLPGLRPASKKDWAAELTGYAMRPLFLADARLTADHMAGAIAAASAPDLPTARARTPTAFATEVQQHRMRHPLAAMMLPSLDRYQEQTYRDLTERRMASVAIAVRWYALDHGGARPARLEDLVPTYLPSVPLDALAAGQPLRYVPGPDPIVYSAGPNGIDDGGSELPVRKRGQPPQEWEMLDRVLHLNRQPRPPPEPEETSDLDAAAPDTTGPATAPTSRPATTQSAAAE